MTDPTAAAAAGLVPERVITADRAERDYWHNVWRFRELLFFLGWRDVVVRYKQTVIGVAWAVVRPLITIAVFVVVFGRIAGLPSDGVPYTLLVCAGMLPWFLFATALGDVGNSLINNANLVSKVAFPRLIVPLSAVAAALVDFLVALGILFGLVAWYGVVPTWRLAFLPAFILMAMAAAAGLGLVFASLSIRYRDFRYILPFVLQFGVYVTPVGYSTAVVPAEWQWAFALNPMVGVIDGVRWSVLGDDRFLTGPDLLLGVPVVLALLAAGVAVFRRYERDMVDVL